MKNDIFNIMGSEIFSFSIKNYLILNFLNNILRLLVSKNQLINNNNIKKKSTLTAYLKICTYLKNILFKKSPETLFQFWRLPYLEKAIINIFRRRLMSVLRILIKELKDISLYKKVLHLLLY